MAPGSAAGVAGRTSAPRTRGDVPAGDNVRLGLNGCPPHPQGWSSRPPDRRRRRALLPAPAGTVPRIRESSAGLRPAPRTRGDGPFDAVYRPVAEVCSPHPRGGPRAHYAIVGLVACSPHPRGWSQDLRRGRGRHRLLPARAGMVPSTPRCGTRSPTAPRTRGGGPGQRDRCSGTSPCSPHLRGWSRLGVGRRDDRALLPAPARMVPRCPQSAR